jgi:hypothetical protein
MTQLVWNMAEWRLANVDSLGEWDISFVASLKKLSTSRLRGII